MWDLLGHATGEPAWALVGIRFIFSTGYGAGGIDPTWRDQPVLQKPFSQAELETALERAVKGPPPRA